MQPEPIGHYSQVVTAGDFLFLSGQISPDPKSGDVGKQTEQILKNITAILTAKKLDLSAVVKTTIFLKDISKFSIFNEVYARAFGSHKPARSCVEVSNLPKGADIEIEVVAYLGD